MNTTTDMDQFFDLLDATYDLLGKTPAAKIISAGSKEIFFNALRHFTIEEVRAGLNAHCLDGTFTPVPNDIKVQIERRRPMQWIGADEAYALLPLTEDTPGLLNQVTGAALAAAAPFLAQRKPDENAARMAFRAAYNRLVDQEKLAGRPPRYWVSPAGSIEAQNAVRADGVRLGLLNSTWAPPAAPQLGHTPPPAGALEALRGFAGKAMPLLEGERTR